MSIATYIHTYTCIRKYSDSDQTGWLLSLEPPPPHPTPPNPAHPLWINLKLATEIHIHIEALIRYT